MASAAAGLGTRALGALALSVFVATALLAVLNPWLAVFAVAGFVLGWVVRNRRRFVAGIVAGIGLKHLTESPKRIAGGLGALAAVAAAGLTVWQYTDVLALQGPPSIRRVVPVSYSADATLETERETFALSERLVVAPESLRLLRDEAAPQKPAELVTRQLARTGWGDPKLVGETLQLSREGRSEAAQFGRLTRRATLALPIPEDLGGEADLAVTEATVEVVAPKHWVLATAPPSEAETLPGDLEQRRIKEEDALDEERIEVELGGPLFRNELGASMLGLSVAGAVKWGVLLVFGVLQDELKKLVGGILGRLRRRRGPSESAEA
jgi:hypothetical protein